jgi:NitT/TauT family transport system permease protein
VVGIGAILIAWAVSTQGPSSEFQLVPTPQSTLLSLRDMLTSADFWAQLLATLERMALGFAASVLLGLVLGVAIGLSRVVSSLLGGIIDALKYTPVSAFIPLTIIWFGIENSQKIVVIALGTAPYMTVMVADAIRSTRAEYIESGLTLGASRLGIMRRVVLPSAAPQMWDAARLSFAIAWGYVLTAELVGANVGLGRFLILAERFVNTREMFAGTILIGVIGFFSDLFFRATYRRIFPWMQFMTRRGDSHV